MDARPVRHQRESGGFAGGEPRPGAASSARFVDAASERLGGEPDEPDDLSREVYGVLGIPIDRVEMDRVLDHIDAAARNRTPFLLSTPNINFLANSWSDEEFRDSLLLSDLCPPDGAPILWIARLLAIPIRERVAGSDIFEGLKSTRSADEPLKVFLFGGAENVAENAAKRLNAESTGMICVASYCPPFASVDALSANAALVDIINASAADFLVVALGAIKGQLWLKRNHYRLRIPVRAHFGATINFQAGTVKRAPRRLRELGFEWLWRIKEEPYLWRRYWSDGFRLAYLGLTHALPLAIRLFWQRRRAGRRRRSLSVQHEGDGERLIVRFGGDATVEHARQAVNCLREALSAKKRVAVDLSEVQCIDCRFIGVLLMLRKQLGARRQALEVLSCPRRIAKIFRLNGFGFLLAGAKP